MKRHVRRLAQKLGLTPEKRLPLPRRPGEWIDVIRPTRITIELARAQRERETKRQLERALSVGLRATLASGPHDPLEFFDPMTLLQRCVVGWSFEEPVTNSNIERLDYASVVYVARELLRWVDITSVGVSFGPPTSAE